MIGKYLFDLLFASMALVVFAPLMLAIALWVALDSPGPIIFRQIRIGLRGKEFTILKFRTMRSSVISSDPQITIGEDPRITSSGAFLRRYKLDELPQLINVLCGEMSIVGPRPEVPRYVSLYSAVDRELVLSVRPGITDPASIAFAQESTLLSSSDNAERAYVEQIMPAKLALSMQYIRVRTFLGDLAIILRTGWSCLRR